MSTTKLKVGFLIDEANLLPAWEYEMLLELLKAQFIGEVVLIRSVFPLDNIKPINHKSLAFKLFRFFEKIWFRKWPDASTMIDLKDLENSHDKLRIVQTMAGPALESFDIDLLYICFRLKNISNFKIPRYGSWYVQFGDGEYFKAALPAFWEVMHNEIITKAQLIVNLEDGIEERIVYNAISASVLFSVKNNFNSIAWKATHFLPARLRTLYLVGPTQFFENSEKSGFKNYSNKDIKWLYPSGFIMIGMFVRNCFRYLIYKIGRLINKNNFILLYARDDLKIGKMDISKFVKLIPPGKSFWADPFVIEKEENYYIFFEEGKYPGYKGQLAIIRINPDGTCNQPQVILEKSYHLSYPFIFEDHGNYYLIPETSANKTVELYHCKKFPFEWEFSKYLMKDVTLQDPTLFFYNDTWWLFVTTKTPKSSSSNDQLLIYYSRDLFLGDWAPHAGNPVVTDVSNCRPAGKIFMEDNKIFRPAQNNASIQYGYSIKINEIELLTTTEFKEKLVFEISPDEHKEFAAIHTLNATSNMIVMDGIEAR